MTPVGTLVVTLGSTHPSFLPPSSIDQVVLQLDIITQEMSSTTGLNPLAQVGFADSVAYDRHRPSFPAGSVNVLLENVRVAGIPAATIVDLAAGTGKFTELLAERPEDYNIIAIEPHGDMRRVLQGKALKGVSVQDGLSTKIPLENESVDAVIAAQVGLCISFCYCTRTTDGILREGEVIQKTPRRKHGLGCPNGAL